MSFEAVVKIINTSNATGVDLLTLIFIADYAEDDGTGARPSYAALAAKLRLNSRDGARKAIRRLIEKSLIVKHMGIGEKSRTGSRKNVYDLIFEDGSNWEAVQDRCKLFNSDAPKLKDFKPYDKQARYKSFMVSQEIKGGTSLTPLDDKGGTPVTPKGGTPVTPESCHLESCHDHNIQQGESGQKFTIPTNDKGPNLSSQTNGVPGKPLLSSQLDSPPAESIGESDPPRRVADPEYGNIITLWESRFGFPNPHIVKEIGRLYDSIEPPGHETKYQWFDYAITRAKEIDAHGSPSANLVFTIIEGGTKPGLSQLGGIAADKAARQKAEEAKREKANRKGGAGSRAARPKATDIHTKRMQDHVKQISDKMRESQRIAQEQQRQAEAARKSNNPSD